MRRLLAMLIMFVVAGSAQAEELVDPDELALRLTVEKGAATPFVGEMVLLTIEGVFGRAILREQLIQPDLSEFSWMQLGVDVWFDEMQDGLPVKVFRRRMALFPERPGTLEIGAFTHHLTLAGQQNQWFEYDLHSEPVQVEVLPQPETDAWWLPVKRLKVADNWSNAPDRLGENEGVLRTIRVEALGVGPDHLPPMPEMTSPSALILPHPEKRLVDLTAQGPVAVAFWRWTVMPRNPPSAIIEPIELSFFDTVARTHRTVKISPQRVALSDAAQPPPSISETPPPGRIRPGLVLSMLLLGLGVGVVPFLRRRGFIDGGAVLRRLGLDEDRRALNAAVRAGDATKAWRAAHLLARGDALDETARAALTGLEKKLFGTSEGGMDLRAFRTSFLSGLRR